MAELNAQAVFEYSKRRVSHLKIVLPTRLKALHDIERVARDKATKAAVELPTYFAKVDAMIAAANESGLSTELLEQITQELDNPPICVYFGGTHGNGSSIDFSSDEPAEPR